MRQLLFSLAALGLALFPVGVKAAGLSVEEARAVRLREIVDAHFLGHCCHACGEHCSAEEIIASLDPHSRLMVGPTPDLDFIRGLSTDSRPLEASLDEAGRIYVKLASFGRRTGHQFVAAVQSLLPSCSMALVLDLRGNGGGYLDSALQVAEAFVPAGTLLLTIAGRSGVRVFQSTHPPRFSRLAVEVLVDEKTASSAEVLAWLLRHYTGARITGSRTAGKGTVQEVYRVDPHTRLVLTTAVYRFPDGTMLDGNGIEPDANAEDQLTGVH